jgi:hypothetical protein
MIISPSPVEDVYIVRDVYNNSLLDQFLAENIIHVLSRPLTGQQAWLRETRQDFPKSSVWHAMLQSIDFTQINRLGYKLAETAPAYWLDMPGFTTGIHVDNLLVQASLQVYLEDNDPKFGTQFYDKNRNLIFTVPYAKNTGYLLINRRQLHGMITPCPFMRKSTYTWLTPKS